MRELPRAYAHVHNQLTLNTGWDFANAADPDDPAYLDSLMPWSESLPAGIRLKPGAAEEAARMADDPIICQ